MLIHCAFHVPFFGATTGAMDPSRLQTRFLKKPDPRISASDNRDCLV